MDRLLRLALGHFIRSGNLRLTTAEGAVFMFGDGTGTPVAIRFTSQCSPVWSSDRFRIEVWRSLFDGTLIVEQERSPTFSLLSCAVLRDGKPPWWARLQWVHSLSLLPVAAVQPAAAFAPQHVAHHYDLDGQLYALFLDADRQYSCAYFERLASRSDDAQLPKTPLGGRASLNPNIACSISGALGRLCTFILRRYAERA
jgi:cyclopropane-fatty-acyl-phospholipid synthase